MKQDFYPGIGDRIKEVRKAGRLTQKGFGKRIGVSDAHISNLEAGKDLPSDTLVQSICLEFSINDRWLAYGNENDIPSIEGEVLFSTVLQQISNLGISVEQFLKKTGIAKREFDALKYGPNFIKLDLLLKIGNFFEVSIDDLMQGVECCYSIDSDEVDFPEEMIFYEKIAPSEEQNVLSMYRKLTESDQEMVISLLRRLSSNRK